MKHSIITSAQVVDIAFSDGGYLSPDAIAEADIASAVERWVKPVVGEALLEEVVAGKYEELREEFLSPVVAFYTRLLVQQRLNAVSSQAGLAVSVGTNCKVAEESLRREHLRAIKLRARTALKALSDYLNAHADEIAEYEPQCNILNRCSCDVGIVQIF
jgi:hypothetical protein